MRPAGRLTAVAVLALTLAACKGGEVAKNESTDQVVTTGPAAEREVSEVITVRPDGNVEDAAATPVNERVATLGVLNKRNGVAREFKLKPGQAARIDNIVVRLKTCDKTAPWETDQLTGAFIQVDVEQLDKSWHRVFSGWLYAERPALNVVRHPIYDVWPKSCAMTFRESGADTVAEPAASAGPAKSKAKKSPSTEGAPNASPAEASPKAAISNAI